jgi:hypothetical protein
VEQRRDFDTKNPTLKREQRTANREAAVNVERCLVLGGPFQEVEGFNRFILPCARIDFWLSELRHQQGLPMPRHRSRTRAEKEPGKKGAGVDS